MLARRDTRREAARGRRLSPLQAVEDQSQAWGICCHSCTWREGFAPSWRTELHSFWLCGLPEDLGPLSTNGSHLDKGRVDLPATGRKHLLDGCKGAEHHAVPHSHQTPPAHGLHHLRIEQLGQGYPAQLGRGTFVLSTWWLYPLPVVGEQRGQILPEPIGEKQRSAVGGQHLRDVVNKALRHGQCAIPYVKREQEFALRVHGDP